MNKDWEMIPYLLYSPDFALSNDTLFHPLKQFLGNKSFTKHEDPKLAHFDFFNSQLSEFWAKRISYLPMY